MFERYTDAGKQKAGGNGSPPYYALNHRDAAGDAGKDRTKGESFAFKHGLITGVWLSLAILLAAPAPARSAAPVRLSLDPLGAEVTGPSFHPILSADGQYVSFWSNDDTLVAVDGNTFRDAFLRGRTTGTTERTSEDDGGAGGNADAYAHAVSTDGRYTVFFTAADNLVAGDTNGKWDVFVHDRTAGTTERVSVTSLGAEGNGDSANHAISGDGRYVVFQSDATNLVAGDTNAAFDIFVHDRTTGETSRVSVDSTGNEANGSSTLPSISTDGRYVAFQSDATNLVALDTNASSDIFVHDLTTGDTWRVSVDSTGNEANGVSVRGYIDGSGEFVVFMSRATNLEAADANTNWDVYLHDLVSGATELVSVDTYGNVGNSDSESDHDTVAVSGQYVLFVSAADNLVPGDTNAALDVFLRDRTAGTTERISVDANGVEGDGASEEPTISADGRYVVFQSAATNLVAGDTNAVTDVFLVAGPVPEPAAPSPASPTAASGGCSATTVPTTWGDAAGMLLMLFAPLLWAQVRRRKIRVRARG